MRLPYHHMYIGNGGKHQNHLWGKCCLLQLSIALSNHCNQDNMIDIPDNIMFRLLRIYILRYHTLLNNTHWQFL